MAEQVARIKILAQIDGLEGFDKLKGAFKGLQQAIGPADTDLSKARKEIIEFGKAGAKTEQVIRGQIDALKALQGQASIGGAVYRQLGKDIKDLGGAYREAATGVKQFTDAALKSQKPGAKASTFGPQIQAFKKDLAELSVYSQQYTELLTKIQRRELPFNLAQGRQNVLAAAEAYRLGPDLANQATRMPGLPDTTAGLNQRLSELSAELLNVSRGGERWIAVSREIAQVQREMARTIPTPEVQAAQARLQASRAINSGSGFRAFSYRADQLAARADAEAQAALERRQTLYSRPIGPPPPSDLFRNIAGISNATASNQLQLMGRSYGEVAASIRATTAASDGSINSLRAQRNAWEALRNTLGSNKAALRAVDQELDQIDRKLEKRSRSGGGIGPKLQAAGAIASGAIFGGPEGLLGGLGGAALGSVVPGLGTVGGAFAGSFVGGTVSQLRQQAAGIGNYVRDLNLAKTTLAQASAGQDEYNRLLESARRISSDYAVGLKETINGYAQVAVAARANGLTLKETENIYRGLVASGVAFGKSQEDLDAIVTATVQVLSKGKLSAEELQGQIGERLPGAVAKFAAATGRSLPQLAKDLEQGNVKIADFVKFAERQLKDYDEIAKIIGDSPEKAGTRLQIALDTAAETYGGFFQQIGAGFQDNLAQIVSWFNANEETIKEWVTTWVNAGRDIVNVITAIANTLKPVLAGFADFVNRAYQFYQNSPQGMLANAAQGAVRNIFGVENQAPLKSSDIFPEFKPGAFGSGGGTPGNGKTDLDTEALERARKDQLKTQLDIENKLREAAERNAEQLADLRERTIKRAVELERDLGDQRLDIERRIAETRREIAGQEQDLALERERQRLSAAGLDTSGIDAAQELAEISRRYSEERIQNEYAAVDRQTALQRQIEEFKTSVADSIGKLQEGYARSVADILQSAGDKLAMKMVSGAQVAAGVLAGAPAAPVLPGPGGGLGPSTLRTGSVQGGTLGVGTLVGLAKAAGFNDRDAQIMAAVAMAESSGRSTAHNNNARTGDNSYGLWQINMLGQMGPERRRSLGIGSNDALFDPATNARAARQIYQSQGFNAWSVFRSGAYRQYLPAAMGAAPAGPPAAVAGFDSSGIMSRLQGAAGKVGAASQADKAAQDQKAFNDLFNSYTDRFGAYKQELDGAGRSIKEQYEDQQRIFELMRTGLSPELARQRVATENIANKEIARLEALDQQLGKELTRTDLTAQQRQQIEDLRAAVDKRLLSEQGIVDAMQAQARELENLRLRQDTNIGAGLREGAQQYVESIGTMREATAQLAQNGIKGVEDAIFSLVTTGTANFKEFAANILKDTARMIIQQLILRTIMQAIGAIGGGGFGKGYFDPLTGKGVAGPNFGFAKGGAFAQNGIIPFAMGGIVDKPTLFKFANGGAGRLGLMGEAGPEAIVPLKRGRDGKLGVASSGGSTTNVTVNVDASGSNVQGDSNRGEQLGRVVSQAVQQELIKQRRPGGLLAA